MKKRRFAAYISAVLAAAMVLSACGGSSSGNGAISHNASYAAKEDGYYSGAAMEAPADADYEASYEEAGTTANSAGSSGIDVEETEAATTEEKLVYTCDLSIETLTFEESNDSIHDVIEKYHGIIQSESVSDSYSDWYYSDSSKSRGTLTANLTVRIPSKSYQAFLTDLEGVGGKITNRSQNVENITKVYNDQSVLIASLEKQEERLNAMMDAAETIEDMITVEARLTDVQTQLNQARTRLASMDTDVAYSTVYIYLREGFEYKNTTTPRTFPQRLAATFKDSIATFLDVMEGLLNLAIYLLPFAILAGIILFLLRPLLAKWRQARRERKARKAEEKARRAAGAASSLWNTPGAFTRRPEDGAPDGQGSFYGQGQTPDGQGSFYGQGQAPDGQGSFYGQGQTPDGQGPVQYPDGQDRSGGPEA